MCRILIVDDEDVIRFLICETLSLNQYEIYQACDGTEALALIDKIDPHIVILDSIMPGLRGIEVAKIISTMAYKPVVIMLTASIDDNDKAAAMETGVDHFMHKPFSPIDLLHLVEKIAEQECAEGKV